MRRLFATLAVGTLLLALNPPATASHPSWICLDLEPDQHAATSNDDIIDSLRAYPGATDAGHPPEHEGCVTELVEPGQDWSGTNIDFEVIGAADPDSSNSVNTPDMTCTVPDGSASCFVFPPSADDSTQTIRGWIDSDLNDGTVEADTAEGVDEGSAAGDSGEPDTTDVASWYWDTTDTTAESAVTIGYGRVIRRFRGWVTSDYDACSGARTVNVYRRRDEKRLIGSVETDGSGRWRLGGLPGRVRGRFWAVAEATTRHTSSPGLDVACSRARSETMRLP